jgi:hypothetical protein
MFVRAGGPGGPRRNRNLSQNLAPKLERPLEAKGPARDVLRPVRNGGALGDGTLRKSHYITTKNIRMATLIDLSLDTDEPVAEQQGVLFVEGRNEPIKFPIHLGPANALREAGLFLTHDLYDMDDNEYRRPLPESQQRWVLASRGTSTIVGSCVAACTSAPPTPAPPAPLAY